MMEEFQKKLTTMEKPEEKIKECLDFMRLAIGDKTPRFKDFWECKKVCLPLFKEGLGPSVRSHLWGEYVEISTEARALKEILDEKSAFAHEQIDLAIQALEKDLERYDELVAQMPKLAGLEESDALRGKKEIYNTLQKELNLLNTFAARVSGLRKEVMKTDMRIRFKNKLFDRLSKAGDLVFPRRKELIKKVSTEFVVDVTAFVKTGLDGNYAREEIKLLQVLAKELSLDTAAFTEARLQLSKGWDQLKEKVVMKQESFQKNFDLVMDKIKPLVEKCQSEGCTIEEAMKMGSAILSFMKNIELSPSDVKKLRDEIHKAKGPVLAKQRKEQEEKERVIEETHRQKREKLEQLKQEIQATAENEGLGIEEMQQLREEFMRQMEGLSLTSAEKDLFDDLIKGLRDQIIEKKEKAMMLSPEVLKSLEQLNAILDARRAQRQEIKEHLEGYRKALSGSGFDFEKAMRYRELIDAEKARFDSATAAIEEIEEKIAELED
jgi:hypothetical protein